MTSSNRKSSRSPTGGGNQSSHSTHVSPDAKALPPAVRPHPLFRVNKVFISAFLCLLAGFTFLPIIRNDFVNLDDPMYVYENVHVQHGFSWEAIRWAFTTLEGGFWHPLTWLSIMLDCRLYGLHPGGHHFTNVLLHAANTLLLFLVFQRMTGATWRSAVVAALFAVHPLHVESVAWAAERKDVLSALFFMLTIWAYARYVETTEPRDRTTTGPRRAVVQGSRFKVQSSRFFVPIFHPPSLASPKLSGGGSIFYFLALLFFACGLMSKSMVVTLPVVLLLLDYWPLRRGVRCEVRSANPSSQQWRWAVWRRLAVEKAPFFAASVASGVVTLFAQKAAHALLTPTELPLMNRIANAIVSYAHYLLQMLWPRDLAVYYPFQAALPLWLVAASALLGAAAVTGALRASRKYPYLGFGSLWYVIILLPVIGLVQVGGQSQADRYTYLPLIGVFTILAWGVHDLTRRWRLQVIALSAAAASSLLACVVLTCRQLGYWKESETLFRRALAVTKDNELAHNSLGSALVSKGRRDEALPEFEKAVELMPDFAEAQNNLGAALAAKGRFDEALGHLQEAARLTPANPGAHCNLGDVLAKTGQMDEAITQYHRAITLKPDEPDPHCHLADVLIQRGRPEEAVPEYRQALKLNPNDAAAHCNLGHALSALGRFDEASLELHEALRLKPDFPDAQNELGLALGILGRLDEAVGHFKAALSSNPNHAAAHCNLGIALVNEDHVADAVDHLQTALRLRPDYPEAHCNLGVALIRQGRLDEASAHLREALRLRPGYPEAQAKLQAALSMKSSAENPPAR
jgi:tetratricopeptide (TPR) repeat protein